MLNGLRNMFVRTDPDFARHMEEARQKALFTPDLHELQQQENQNIFIYNEIQTGQPQNALLGAKHLFGGVGYTKASDFVLYKKLLGKETFPIAIEVTEDQKLGHSSLIGDPGQIMGEVFTVRSYQMIELDAYLLNTVYFERKQIPIVIPFKTDPKKDTFDIHEISPWMWVAKYEFWKDQLFSPEGKKIFQPSKRLFTAKGQKEEETLGAHYLFDYQLEATKE